jgi:hypothetical protein
VYGLSVLPLLLYTDLTGSMLAQEHWMFPFSQSGSATSHMQRRPVPFGRFQKQTLPRSQAHAASGAPVTASDASGPD